MQIMVTIIILGSNETSIIHVSAPSSASELGSSMSMQIDHKSLCLLLRKRFSREADHFCYYGCVYLGQLKFMKLLHHLVNTRFFPTKVSKGFVISVEFESKN